MANDPVAHDTLPGRRRWRGSERLKSG